MLSDHFDMSAGVIADPNTPERRAYARGKADGWADALDAAADYVLRIGRSGCEGEAADIRALQPPARSGE